jgi:tetratricopeptide (TPR) repeat protein
MSFNSRLQVIRLLLIVLLPGAATISAQHVPSGGPITSDAASGSGTLVFRSTHRISRPSSTRRRPVARRPTPDADDYYDQGEKFLDAKQYAEAIEAYKKATRLNPNHADAYYRLGWIYNEQGKYELALDSLNESLRANANEGDTRRRLRRKALR